MSGTAIPSPKWPPGRRAFTSFDRGTTAEAHYFSPDRYSFWDEQESLGRGAISRGAGLSYAAASFRASGEVVEHSHFNRVLGFDSAQSIVEVEAGATLGRVFDFAAPRGLFLAVQPGHPNITIGGCIASDVHGKNQFRDGTFISRVQSLRLFHPGHGVLELSRENEPDLFHLTCGGYGLTGNIVSARIRLTPAPSTRVAVRIVPVADIFRLPEALLGLADRSDLLYSWHDFTARGSRFGSGHVVSGTFDGPPEGAGDSPSRSFQSTDSFLARRLPVSLWNSWTTPIFNRLFDVVSQLPASSRSVPLYDFLFPVARKMSYFHFFGRRGFHEYQLVVPIAAFTKFVEGIRAYLNRRPLPISLASAKLFRGSRDLLRFTGDGICLALNLPRRAGTESFLSTLDELMVACDGWPNLIKDSRLSAGTVSSAYPDYETFRRRRREFDPKRLYRSELSDRLDL